jgi:hypothetical protein
MATVPHPNPVTMARGPRPARRPARYSYFNIYPISGGGDEFPQAMAKLAGYHSPTSRECTKVEYASPEWEWAMIEMPGSPTLRKRAHEQLEAEIDELGSDQSEAEVRSRTWARLRGFLTNGNVRFNKRWTVSKRLSLVTAFHEYRMLACHT